MNRRTFLKFLPAAVLLASKTVSWAQQVAAAASRPAEGDPGDQARRGGEQRGRADEQALDRVAQAHRPSQARCPPVSPKRSSITRRSRSGSDESASRCRNGAASAMRRRTATRRVSSSTKSPSSESSSSPIGFSSETGAGPSAGSRAPPRSHLELPAISSGFGSRPRRWTSWRSMWTTLLSFSTMCTGMRIVRALSAIARVTAWRIHHVA